MTAHRGTLWRILGLVAIAIAAASGDPVAAQPEAGPWEMRAPLPAPRSEIAVAELGGRIYVIGGYPAGRIPSNVVQVYDPVTDTWEYGPPVPLPLHHTMAVN